ncbi:dynein axonemal heavy chain 10-like isoform X2 [Microplitis mediator]|uniref:dynein axonemal heavy chain 10-like isoform X2 n=1 Tax=Microplitis mediator TaxID=375433 RepID=UPI002557746D|nr:dynein axonemal heavy chain 10-like isoform X2 [Microplitis mediator]
MMSQESDLLSIITNSDENYSENVVSVTSTTSDYRILWIWNKVMKFLDLDSGHKYLFDNLLKDGLEDKLMDFFTLDSNQVMGLDSMVLFFHKTYRNEVIQEEVSIWEENKGRSQRLNKSAYGKIEKTDEEKKKKGKKSKKGKKDENYEGNNETLSTLFSGVTSTHMNLDIDDDEDNEESATQEDYEEKNVVGKSNSQKIKTTMKRGESLRSLFAPLPGEEDKYILTKKVVDKVIEIPVIHITCGQLTQNDPELMKNNFFYFLRTSDEKIPNFDSQETCDDEILNYIVVGSLNGFFLESLNEMLVNVFAPLMEKQLYAESPKRIYENQDHANSDNIMKTDDNSIDSESQTTKVHKSLEDKESSIKIESFEESQKQLMSPGKDFTHQRISSECVEEYSESLKTFSDPCPKNIKKTNIKQLLKYLEELIASVQWNFENIGDDILIPLPKSSDLLNTDFLNIEFSALDRNMIEQLENIVINWEKHINKVLDTYKNKIPQGKGPMAEYDYWHDRLIGLSILVENLNSPIAKKIKSILNEARSSILSAFHWFEIELWKYYTEARENNKFLFTVLRYFKLITESNELQVINEALPSLMEGMKMIWILSKYFNTEERMTLLLESISWQLCENIKNTLSVKELFRKPLEEISLQAQNAYKMLKSWKTLYLVTRENIESSEKGKRWEFDQQRLFSETEYIAKVCNDFNEIASVLQNFYNIFGPELKSIITDPAQIDVIVKRVDELIEPILHADFNIFNKLNQENWDATMAWFYLEVTSLQNEALFLMDDCFMILINAEQALEVLLKFKNIQTRQAIQECLSMKFDVIMQQFNKEINKVENIFNLVVIQEQTVAKIKNIPARKLRCIDSQTQEFSSGGKNLYFDSAGSKMGSGLKSLANKVLKLQINFNKIDETLRPVKITDDKIMVEQQLCFQVNFDLKLFEIICEAEMLEQLGFELSTSIRDLGIQKDRLKVDIELIQTTIDQYNGIMTKLDVADVRLLKNMIKNIDKYIQSGVTRLNWYSLDIPNFAAHSKKLLKNLESVITQVNHIKKDLDNRIEHISTYNLVTTSNDPTDSDYKLLQCNMYFSDIKAKRTKLVDGILKAYQSISPILIKLESLVENTTTGKSKAMQFFYERYEQTIFTAFITCLVSNLDALNILLSGNKSIFVVDAVLLSSEVILRPSPNEINIIILRDIKDLLARFKLFPRWAAGSCHECKQIKETSTDSFYRFSFFDNVMSIQIINDRIAAIQNTTQRLTVECWKYLNRWKKYSNLWRADKSQICEKFVVTCPTLNQYDEKFTYYDTIIEEIEEWTPYYDISSIKINLTPLLKSIKEHAQKWKQLLGDYLISETKQSMKNLTSIINIFRSELELVINSLSRFKAVMQTIGNIKKMSIQAMVQYNEYQETFKTLRTHGIVFLPELEDQARKIQKDWESIYFESLYRATTLESTKERFRQMTEEQISDLLKECEEFAEYFNENGPGSVGNDLDSGLIKMEEFEKLINTLEERRLDLVNAEILFDLPPTNFSIFISTKQDFEDMKLIYSLYKTQKDAKEIWSKTLWSDLNSQQLIDEIDLYINEFRKLPETVKQLDIGKVFEMMLESFRNSVPLFVELKNEAMRERHWKELMDKTGKHVDFPPDTLGG